MITFQKISLQRFAGISSILGIDITEDRIRIVELKAHRGIFNKFLSKFTAEHYVEIKFETGLSQEQKANKIAVELKSRKIKTKYASTTIQSLGVRSVVTEIPSSIKNISEWIHDNFEKLLRIPVAFQEIAIAYEVLSTTQTSKSLEVTFVRKSELDEIMSFVSKTGLTLLSLSAGTRDALNTLLYSKEFQTKENLTFAYVSQSDVSISEFENQKRVRTFQIDKESFESQFKDSNCLIAGETKRTGDNVFLPFSLPAEYALAAGCAIKGFIPEFHMSNFLPTVVTASNHGAVTKDIFHRTVIACGGLIILFLAILTVGSLYIDSVNEELDQTLFASGLNYSELSLLEKQNTELRTELKKTDSPEYRSNTAKLFHDIAAVTPGNVWFYKIETDFTNNVIKISGYARGGEAVGEFLKKCETSASFKDLRLIRSGVPLQSEDLTFVSRKVQFPITFELQAALTRK